MFARAAVRRATLLHPNCRGSRQRMCGIAGELKFSDAPSGAHWPTICALMARRGPDDEGMWSSLNGRCTFAFRRLAIQDLSPNGHQPMLAANDRYALVFNGEVYNFHEIKAELVHSGVVFRSSGDAEVVLYALMRWGPAALERFNGMYALALYDNVERRLLIARDHVGIKPLYVLQGTHGIAFASQYDQLLAHPWSHGLAVSQDALALYLRIAFVPAPLAILNGTRMLEPGTWIEIDANGRRSEGRHFEFPRDAAPTLRGADATDALDKSLSAAVKRQLVSDVPVAAFLSGGIDSPLVVAKMVQAGAAKLRAFTIGTDDAASDESSDAAAYAQALGVAHTIERVVPNDAVALLDDVIAACGEPLGDYSMFPTMLVARLAAREFKVVLSGDGGDELFWGYVRRMAQIATAAPDFEQPFALRAARWALPRLAGRPYGPEHLRWRNIGDGQKFKHTHLRGDWLRRIFPTLPAWPASYDAFDYTGTHSDDAAQWQRWNELVCHLTMVLLKVDRASMYHSLEVRVPILDREVIATAAQVDWRTCLDVEHNIGKLPLRKLLARYVPQQTTAKRGFEVPMGAWLRTSLRGVFEDAVLAKNSVLGLPINRRAIRRLFDRHLSGAEDHAWGLWPILSLALWEERHLRPSRIG
jgi:asparagine synthase (glutamine-hydrolysing)